MSFVFGPEAVGVVLKRRGFIIESRGNNRDILLPLNSTSPLSGEQFNKFRHLFGGSTFRKLVRKITSEPEPGQASKEQLMGIGGNGTYELHQSSR
jgi:hypothetical protein